MKNLLFLFAALMFLATSCKNSKPDVVITNVYEGEEGRSVLYDTKEKKENLLLSDNFSQFNILYRTSDNYWIIVEKTPLFVGEGRVETEYILLYLPEGREVNVETYDPSLSYYGIRIEQKDGVDCLVTTKKDGNEDIFIPLEDLLKGKSESTSAEPREVTEKNPEDETAAGKSGEKDLIAIKVGTNENEIGQGMGEKQLDGGRFIYAVPSFAAFNNLLYIVDAINFRILVFDYSGAFIRKVSYPQTASDGSIISMRDIAVDNDYIYLVSNYENSVYVIDLKTDDVATILKDSGTGNGKFGSVDRIAVDKVGNLLIADTWDNTLYTYTRDNFNFTLKKTDKFTGSGQLSANLNGIIYSATVEGSSFTLKGSDGSVVATVTDTIPVARAEVIATDNAGNIYTLVNENDPMSQLGYTLVLTVVAPGGSLLKRMPVWSWPGGSMTRHIVVDNDGSVFEGYFTGSEMEDSPPTDFIVRKRI